MAYGKVNIDTIQSSTAGTPPQFNDGNSTQIGTLCRAWVNFVGSSGTRNASFNVSSVTRTGTGVYTVAFSSALTDANYAALITTTSGNVYGAATTLSTSSVIVDTRAGSTGGSYDAASVCVSVFR